MGDAEAMARTPHHPQASVRRVVGAAACVLLLSGCGSASEQSPPAGVDELVIPTPSPRPADFVARIDNPWLPLSPGRSWTYDVGTPGAPAGGTREVDVLPGSVGVAGVATTAVRDALTDAGGSVSSHTDYYAQDSRGNVWWFGRSGQWRAGESGARAGLAMAAAPRAGDGYRLGYLPGQVEDHAEVLRVGAGVVTPLGSFDDVVLVASTTGAGAAYDTASYYSKGVGLVRRENGNQTGAGRQELLTAVSGG